MKSAHNFIYRSNQDERITITVTIKAEDKPTAREALIKVKTALEFPWTIINEYEIGVSDQIPQLKEKKR